MHNNVIISDASCIIALENIGSLQLLKSLFGNIETTPEVVEEIGFKPPEWISIIAPADKIYQKNLELLLDKGEASAIALAVEFENCLLLIDEIKGRKIATSLNLKITGTIGILLSAKNHNIIPKVAPLLIQLKNVGFYISQTLFIQILKETGEML
jgi:predicted nucleic acid-binding protein